MCIITHYVTTDGYMVNMYVRSQLDFWMSPLPSMLVIEFSEMYEYMYIQTNICVYLHIM